jgi:hypothetical protein
MALVGCETEKELTSLQGTKWKLKGIVDINTDKLTELEPKNSEECYTLVFDTDSTASGRSVFVEFNVIMKERVITEIMGLGTYIGESYDGDLFRTTMSGTKSYIESPIELKFFNNYANKYLIFKPVN